MIKIETELPQLLAALNTSNSQFAFSYFFFSSTDPFLFFLDLESLLKNLDVCLNFDKTQYQ